MSKLAVITLAVIVGFGGLAIAEPTVAQPAGGDEQRELSAARAELERARAALEEAAREVARLSAEHVGELGDGLFIERVFRARRPLLGINIENAEGGVRVAGVSPNGAADQAGVMTGDVIVAIDGAALAASDGRRPTGVLLDHLADVEAGATVELTIDRNGAALTIPVTTSTETASVWLDELRGLGPAMREATRFALPRGRGAGFFIANPFAGAAWRDMELVELTPALGAYFGTEQGLLVVRAPEDETIGLRDGDVILTIAGRTPASVEHAMRILASFEPDERLELAIMREQRRRTLEFEMPARRGAAEDVEVRILHPGDE